MIKVLLIAISLSLGLGAMQQQEQQGQFTPPRKLQKYRTDKIITCQNNGGYITKKRHHVYERSTKIITNNKGEIRENWCTGDECNEDFPIGKVAPCGQEPQDSQWQEQNCNDQDRLLQKYVLKTDKSSQERRLYEGKNTCQQHVHTITREITEEGGDLYREEWDSLSEDEVQAQPCQKGSSKCEPSQEQKVEVKCEGQGEQKGEQSIGEEYKGKVEKVEKPAKKKK